MPNLCHALKIAALACSLCLVAAIAHVRAADEEDLRALATARCDIPGLTVVPPAPWYSVPIDSGEDIVEGCQMIWEEGDQYMGIMRLLSFDLRERPGQLAEWENFVVAFESMVMQQMGFTLGEPIWKRDAVPVSGEGFGNGKAIGLAATLEGDTAQREAHFMLFESASHKYVISILTPAQELSPDVYAANTGAMGTLMRTLQPR